MVGDAAGLVDAITGEGLFYALRSAEIFAQTMIAGAPERYAGLAETISCRNWNSQLRLPSASTQVTGWAGR